MNSIFTNTFEFILEAEKQGWITRTFRRLDPDRQNAIILAILEEAGDNGPSEINIRQVAARCNIAIGSLYQYFGNREKLVDFTIELVVRETTATFESYTEYLAAMPLREALHAYVGGGFEWTNAQLGMARLFARAAYQGAPGLSERIVRPIAKVLQNMMLSILIAARERGEIRQDIDIEVAARLVNIEVIAIADAKLFPHLNEYYRLYDDTRTLEEILNSFYQLLETGYMSRKSE